MEPDYSLKFESFRGKTLYEYLNRDQQDFIREIAFADRFTFQEFRRVAEVCRDLDMWQEGDLREWWSAQSSEEGPAGPQRKKRLLNSLEEHLAHLRRTPTVYPEGGLRKPPRGTGKAIRTEKSAKAVAGMCPVASPKTVCCNLRTIDAVECCPFGCTYCSIQTFYEGDIIIDENLDEKLQGIELAPDRFYHFGSGQASDSLACGNRAGILDALCRFARRHPNVLMELKTKSDQVRYFVDNEVPPNVVCSWSLNTPTIIEHEEHLTPSLENRLKAARSVADIGVRVAFHFHPMVYYQGWEEDYASVATAVLDQFDPGEVLFVSLGAVTLIKPVIRKIRELGHPTRILQMEQVADPHGRLTYPDEVKVRMFKALDGVFRPWHGKVFRYLCMEKPEIWEQTFGRVYGNNEEFERDFGEQVMRKVHLVRSRVPP